MKNEPVTLTHYLNQRFKPSTVHGIVKRVNLFTQWCETSNITPQNATYTELLEYLKHCSTQGFKTATANQRISVLVHYFNYYIAIGARSDNPAHHLRMRNVTRPLPCEALKYEVLENIYSTCTQTTTRDKCNKMLLGLMIYQGLNTSEIKELELNDIDIINAKITVPTTAKSNSRVLILQGIQIVLLQEYITTIRLNKVTTTNTNSTKLLLTKSRETSIHNRFSALLKWIQAHEPKVKSLQQLRVSVIVYWYKLYTSREVQYRVGHKYVSSTERYRTDKLESLQQQLEQLHPSK